MSTNIDTRSAFCDKCHAAIRQYDTDGGLWLTDCLGGGYDCGAGGLHVAPMFGESLPEAFISATVRGLPAYRYIDLVTECGNEIALAPFEARQLAGVLLARAEEIESMATA